MTLTNVADVYPLSPMQQGILFHSITAPDSGVYFEQAIFRVTGALDVATFRRVWATLTERHEILRTCFLWEGLDEPVQVVRGHVSIPLHEEDWRGLDPEAYRARLDELLRCDREQGFQLSRAPLLRLALLRVTDETADFVWSHHHALLDGWSVALLAAEAQHLYETLARGGEIRSIRRVRIATTSPGSRSRTGRRGRPSGGARSRASPRPLAFPANAVRAAAPAAGPTIHTRSAWMPTRPPRSRARPAGVA